MAGLSIYDIGNIVDTQFPDLAPLLQQPGVAQVVIDYINSMHGVGEPWTPAQLQARLRATPYYQNVPKTQRDWDLLMATDPATAGQKIRQTKGIVEDLQQQLGILLDTRGGLASQSFQFLQQAVTQGWDANEIKYNLIAETEYNPAHGGELGKNAADLRKQANDMGVPMSDNAVLGWARKLSEGTLDQNAWQGYLIEGAKSLFPGLSDALDRGITVRQYADPYIQLAAQELDINPSDVNLTDRKWIAALNQVDPKTGQRVSMALDSWLAKLRSDPAYGFDRTAKGRQDATVLATQLQQKFGNAA